MTDANLFSVNMAIKDHHPIGLTFISVIMWFSYCFSFANIVEWMELQDFVWSWGLSDYSVGVYESMLERRRET